MPFVCLQMALPIAATIFIVPTVALQARLEIQMNLSSKYAAHSGDVTCTCTTPNEGTKDYNSYSCDDGTSGSCSDTEYCYSIGDFKNTEFSRACSSSQGGPQDCPTECIFPSVQDGTSSLGETGRDLASRRRVAGACTYYAVDGLCTSASRRRRQSPGEVVNCGGCMPADADSVTCVPVDGMDDLAKHSPLVYCYDITDQDTCDASYYANLNCVWSADNSTCKGSDVETLCVLEVPPVAPDECKDQCEGGSETWDEKCATNNCAACRQCTEGWVMEEEEDPEAVSTDQHYCNCTTPNQGTDGHNSYTCDDGSESHCPSNYYCYAIKSFKKGDLSHACYPEAGGPQECSSECTYPRVESGLSLSSTGKALSTRRRFAGSCTHYAVNGKCESDARRRRVSSGEVTNCAACDENTSTSCVPTGDMSDLSTLTPLKYCFDVTDQNSCEASFYANKDCAWVDGACSGENDHVLCTTQVVPVAPDQCKDDCDDGNTTWDDKCLTNNCAACPQCTQTDTPTPEEKPEVDEAWCTCSTPNDGKEGFNYYSCDDGTESNCGANQYCYNVKGFSQSHTAYACHEEMGGPQTCPSVCDYPSCADGTSLGETGRSMGSRRRVAGSCAHYAVNGKCRSDSRRRRVSEGEVTNCAACSNSASAACKPVEGMNNLAALSPLKYCYDITEQDSCEVSYYANMDCVWDSNSCKGSDEQQLCVEEVAPDPEPSCRDSCETYVDSWDTKCMTTDCALCPACLEESSCESYCSDADNEDTPWSDKCMQRKCETCYECHTYWTSTSTGCPCDYNNGTTTDCACCNSGGSQCGDLNPSRCTTSGNTAACTA